MDSTLRIQFETDMDELVDLQLRQMETSKWTRRQRARAGWGLGVAFAVSMFAVTAVSTRSVSGSGHLWSVAGLSLVLGVVIALVHRPIHDSACRRRVRAYLQDQLGGQRTWVCEIELRPDGAWARSHGMEYSFSWFDSIAVDDLADGVLLRFRLGMILARNRAFASGEERQRFVQTALAAASRAR